MEKGKPTKFIKYPLYDRPATLFERLALNLHFSLAKCPVCGSFAMIGNIKENLRESCICSACRAFNRYRQIAYVACRAVGLIKQKRISSLRDFMKIDNFIVYNTQACGPIHDQLSKMKGYICSEYFGSSYKSGELVTNILNQDLMNLSLSGESVDLVISSDVFEHISDSYKAHGEVYRILKRGGRHIFTVPFYQTMFLDEDKAVIDGEGNTVFLKEPLHHEDPHLRPEEGILVYKIFSLEMLIKLRNIGFRTNLYQLYKPFYGILGPNAIVFEAIKG